MKATSRTTRAKTSGKAKRPANQSADRVALARARTLLSERPTMKAKTALQKAGVSTPRRIQRLSAMLNAGPAMPLHSNARINARTTKRSVAVSASRHTHNSHISSGRIADQDQFSRRLSALMNASTGEAQPAVIAPRSIVGTGNPSISGKQLNSWTRLFQWSPYGLMLWQATLMADFVSRMTKSSLTMYGPRRR